MRYMKRKLIGFGSYGRVFKADDQQNNEIVAIKTISLNNDAKLKEVIAFALFLIFGHLVIWSFDCVRFSFVFQAQKLSYREIQILRGLHHPNVISLLNVEKYRSKGNKYFEIDLVFEYCDFDLSKLIKNRRVKFTMAQIKGIMVQLLTGIEYIHRDNVSGCALAKSEFCLPSSINPYNYFR